MKSILVLFITLVLTLENGRAVDAASDRTITINIPTDQQPPASAEKVMPIHPFFAAPSTGHEVMEKMQELEERVEKLEKSVTALEMGKS